MKSFSFALVVACVLPAAAAAQAGGRTVEVTVAGAPDTVRAMEEVVRELLARLPVELSWSSATEIVAREVLAERVHVPNVVARVWLDLSDPTRAVIFIANDVHDRFLVRSVPIGGAYGEVAREALGHIVESAVDAMLAGGEIGVTREEAVRELPPEPPPLPRPEPPPPERAPPPPLADAPLASALALVYRAEVLSGGPIVRHGPALTLAWTGFTDRSIDALIWIEAQYHAPVEWDTRTRGARFDGGGARVAFGATGRVGEALAWRASLGIGIDVFRVAPRVAPETGLLPNDPFVVVAPILSALVGGSVHLLPPLDLLVGLGAEADLAGNHYDVDNGATRVEVLSPWRIRPVGFLGLGLRLGGR